MKFPPRPAFRRRPLRGLSIVELMVGLTIGLFIVAAAILVSTGQMVDNRRLLLETQVQQDLRVAADLITRDLRRAGYWAKAYQTISPTTTAVQTDVINQVYSDLSPSNAEASARVEYARSTDEEGHGAITSENNILDSAEQAGFQYDADNQTIEMKLSAGNWQTLTDPNVIKVTRFAIRIATIGLPVPCGDTCPVMGPSGTQQLLQCMRNATIEIEATAANDAQVHRSIRSNVRLRNDIFREGAC